jgi:hypothetical protein
MAGYALNCPFGKIKEIGEEISRKTETRNNAKNVMTCTQCPIISVFVYRRFSQIYEENIF